MKYVALVSLIWLAINLKAQSYKLGDIVFQNLDCGALCDAIEAVTQGYGENSFSHIGLIYLKKDSVFVIEAIGKQVSLTPLAMFESRSSHKLLLGRLKPTYQKLIPNAINFALQQLNKPYDDVFLYDNGKYYCSELLYDAFAFANNGRPFFTLEPMTFKQPLSNDFFPVWVSYYKELNLPIPEGMPGINPGGISRSDKIEIINKK